jgi:hypothetical protein
MADHNKDQKSRGAYARAYYNRNREKILADQKARLLSSPEQQAKKRAQRAASRAKRLAYMREWNAKHKDEMRDYRREWRRQNPHRVRAHKEARRLRDLATQDALAGRPRPTICDIHGGPAESGPGYHNGIVFDHCHQRGHFRGWLCDRCNKVLGAVGDDPDLLRKMITYLDRHRENTSPQLALPGV